MSGNNKLWRGVATRMAMSRTSASFVGSYSTWCPLRCLTLCRCWQYLRKWRGYVLIFLQEVIYLCSALRAGGGVYDAANRSIGCDIVLPCCVPNFPNKNSNSPGFILDLGAVLGRIEPKCHQMQSSRVTDVATKLEQLSSDQIAAGYEAGS